MSPKSIERAEARAAKARTNALQALKALKALKAQAREDKHKGKAGKPITKAKRANPKPTKPNPTKPKPTNQAEEMPGSKLHAKLVKMTKNKKPEASHTHQITFRVLLGEATTEFPGWFRGRVDEIRGMLLQHDDIQMLKETVDEALQNKPRAMVKCGLAPYANLIRRDDSVCPF